MALDVCCLDSILLGKWVHIGESKVSISILLCNCMAICSASFPPLGSARRVFSADRVLLTSHDLLSRRVLHPSGVHVTHSPHSVLVLRVGLNAYPALFASLSTASKTTGRGHIVSKFPLGACNTTATSFESAVTMSDPRSIGLVAPLPSARWDP